MHVVPVKNGINFRELGGVKTKTGATVKKGLLFRSGALSDLTQQDCLFLEEKIKLISILDYRDNSEIEQNPDKRWQGSHYYPIPANPMNAEVTANILQEIKEHAGHNKTGSAFMIKLYQLLPFANPAYKQLVNLLLEDEIKPMVQHCAVGKDRTGVGCALTLFALGADEEAVMQDYLVTEQTLAPFRNHILEQIAAQRPPEELAFQRDIFAAKEEYLATALHAIKQQYKSIDNWLVQDYGLNTQKRTQLENKYLE